MHHDGSHAGRRGRLDGHRGFDVCPGDLDDDLRVPGVYPGDPVDDLSHSEPCQHGLERDRHEPDDDLD